jgi:hypothetical protein
MPTAQLRPYGFKPSLRHNGPTGYKTVTNELGGEPFHRFRSLIGLTLANCTARVLTETIDGLAVIELTSTNGSNIGIDWPWLGDISAPGVMVFHVYTPDKRGTNTLLFDVSSQGFSAGTQYERLTRACEDIGWNQFPATREDFTVVAGTGSTDWSLVNKLRLQISSPVAGSVYKLAVPMYGCVARPATECIMIFDDGRDGVTNTVLPALQARSMYANLAVIASRINQSTYMTDANILAWVAAGMGN